MPQIKAAKKDLRVNARRRAINDRWRNKLRRIVREMKSAVSGNDKKTAEELLPKLHRAIDQAGQHGIIHPNKASRQKSRWTRLTRQAG